MDQWRKGQQVRSRWARGACSGCTMVRRSRQSAGQWQRGRRMCHLLAHTEAVSPLAANHPTLLRPHLPNSHSHMQYEHISIISHGRRTCHYSVSSYRGNFSTCGKPFKPPRPHLPSNHSHMQYEHTPSSSSSGRQMCCLSTHTEAVIPLAANHTMLLRTHHPGSHYEPRSVNKHFASI